MDPKTKTKAKNRKIVRKVELFRSPNCIVATVMAGFEGHRGWVNYLAVLPDFQKQGIGRKIMQEAEKRLRELDCPKINLQVRSSNKDIIAFYESTGFTQDDVISLGKRLDGQKKK